MGNSTVMQCHFLRAMLSAPGCDRGRAGSRSCATGRGGRNHSPRALALFWAVTPSRAPVLTPKKFRFLRCFRRIRGAVARVRSKPHITRTQQLCPSAPRRARNNQSADVSPSPPAWACLGWGSAKWQCSVMAALETAAQPHHTEANPEMVSRAMMMTATRSTTPKQRRYGSREQQRPAHGGDVERDDQQTVGYRTP